MNTRNGGHDNDDWSRKDEVREVIWDKGMPQETREIVRPGDANYHLGTPIKEH